MKRKYWINMFWYHFLMNAFLLSLIWIMHKLNDETRKVLVSIPSTIRFVPNSRTKICQQDTPNWTGSQPMISTEIVFCTLICWFNCFAALCQFYLCLFSRLCAFTFNVQVLINLSPGFWIPYSRCYFHQRRTHEIPFNTLWHQKHKSSAKKKKCDYLPCP